MTLRPASAMWSSAMTPGRLAHDELARARLGARPRWRRQAGRIGRSQRPRRGASTSVVPPSPGLGGDASVGGRDVVDIGHARDPGRPSTVEPGPTATISSTPSSSLDAVAEAAMAASSLLVSARRRPRCIASSTASEPRAASSPLSSSASSSTKRSTTRPRVTTSTSSRLSSIRVPVALSWRWRRSWRIVTSSTSGASPACSTTRARASDAGQSTAGRDPIGRPFQFLAPDRAAGSVRPGERLDRHERLGALLAEPDRESGPGRARRRSCRRSGPRAGSSVPGRRP